MTARTRIAVLLALAALAIVVVVATCDHGTESPLPGTPPPAAATAPRPPETPPPRRAPRARNADTVEASDADAAQPRAVPPAPEPPQAGDATVRVTVTRDGRPAADVDVWVVRLMSAADEGAAFQPETFEAAEPRTFSDGAYFGVPMYAGLWPNHPVPPFSHAVRAGFGEPTSRTGPDGTAVVRVAGGPKYLVRAAAADPLRVPDPPPVTAEKGRVTNVAIAARSVRSVEGRCLRASGEPAAGVMVQAVAEGAERPLSALVHANEDGRFVLLIDGDDTLVRVRVVVPRSRGTPLPLCDAGSQPPPLDADTTLEAVSPDGPPLVIRLERAPVVLLDVSADVGFGHLQIESLVFDAAAGAWGRLGGPSYARGASTGDKTRATIALARSDASRPLFLWSWGLTVTAVDPRGQERLAVKIPRGRRAVVKGDGWTRGDKLRVITRVGPEGSEIPVIWLDGDELGGRTEWARDDSPVGAIEFRILRGGRIAGSATVPAGTAPAPEVRIDL